MVNAIAPNAPSGATLITMPTMRKSVCETMSMSVTSGLPRSPSSASANANSTAKNSTWRMSPSANAPTTVAGMMCIRNSEALCCLACAVYAGIDEVSIAPGSTFMPAPGCQRFTTIRPTTSASVVTASK